MRCVVQRVTSSSVTVNGETCTMRGKKLRPGDKVEYHGTGFEVC